MGLAGKEGHPDQAKGPTCPQHDLWLLETPNSLEPPHPQPFACSGRAELGQSSGVTSAPLWGSISLIRGRASYYRGDHRNQGKCWEEQMKEAPESCWVLLSCPCFPFLPDVPSAQQGEPLTPVCTAVHPSPFPAAAYSHRGGTHRAASPLSLTPSHSSLPRALPQLGLRDTPCCQLVLALTDLAAAFDTV